MSANAPETVGSIGRGPEFHYSRVPKTETGETQSGLTPRAWNIAEHMVKIAQLGAAPAADEYRRKIGNLLGLAGREAGVAFANVGELIDCKDPRVKEYKNDFIDGVGIGTMWGVGVTGTRPEVVTAMKSGNPEEIDLAFGRGTAGIMKGVGRVVMKNLITDQYLVKRLYAIKIAGASQIAISNALTEITNKYSEGQIGNEREAEMIITYLPDMMGGREGQGQQGGGTRQQGEGVDLNMVRSMDRVGSGREGSHPGSVGILEALRARPLEKDPDMASAMNWGLAISELLAANPTYWAGGWQEATSYMTQQMNSIKIDLVGDERRNFEKSRKMVEAIITLRTMESAILACDETLGKYLELTPPVESMSSYVWNKDLRFVLEDDPVIISAHDWIFSAAYGTDVQMKSLLEALKDTNSLDDYVESWAQRVKSNPATEESLQTMCRDKGPDGTGVVYPEPEGYSLKARIRLAMSLFIVDEYPRWASYLNGLAGTKDKDWLPKKMMDRRPNGDTFDLIQVKSTTSNRFGEYTTMVGHPFYALYEPGALLRFKGGSYGEEVIGPFEESFKFLASQVDGPIKVFCDEEGGMMRLSQINGKNLARWAKSWNAIAGDPYGSGMTEYKDLEAAVQQIQSMGTTAQWKYDTCGYVVSKWLIAKFRALRSADPRTAFERIIANIGLISEGKLMEEQSMLEQLLGKGASTTYGVLRDLKAQYGLKFGTEEFYTEFTKFYTGVKKDAGKVYAVGRTAEVVAAALNLFGEMTGKKSSGKR